MMKISLQVRALVYHLEIYSKYSKLCSKLSAFVRVNYLLPTMGRVSIGKQVYEDGRNKCNERIQLNAFYLGKCGCYMPQIRCRSHVNLNARTIDWMQECLHRCSNEYFQRWGWPGYYHEVAIMDYVTSTSQAIHYCSRALESLMIKVL